jgi:hypothetical protein
MSAPDAFYIADRDGFASSELTRGPWDAGSQHAGPPAALIARAIERFPGLGDDPAPAIGRITFEILRPVPIAALLIEVELQRPGRRVDLVSASLRDRDSGAELVRARAWRLRDGEVRIPPGLSSTEAAGAPSKAGRPGGDRGKPLRPQSLPAAEAFFPTGFERGYHSAMEYRFVHGSFLEPGPAVCWMRMRIPLVDGEEPTPLQRVLVAADSGNGISATLDFRRYLFINVDLSVHLHRVPSGVWVCLDSLTIAEPNGQGIADTMLWDERGPLGRACQTLLIAER